MRDALLWWTGAIVWSGVELFVLWLFAQLVVGFVTAWSWFRWYALMMKTYARVPKWRYLPLSFIEKWVEFIGYRNLGKDTWTGVNGYWKGIGDWKVYPAACLPQDFSGQESQDEPPSPDGHTQSLTGMAGSGIKAKATEGKA